MSVCEWCDVPTVAESPLMRDRMEAHREFHAFGWVTQDEILTPMVVAVDRFLAEIRRRLTPT
ncbi:hypothetical protein QUV83_08160 [Cellulomonas cellasea]|uniref:hypothetical protein n=1 Tax=Cellulomonas cellasea TaxID=43670 RepID=UPI0025A345EC|nr:hypothetical protein [Cellulomonas cellasea]MDM8084733.1 hypothetical protein [Cellulomonas cellasea]